MSDLPPDVAEAVMRLREEIAGFPDPANAGACVIAEVNWLRLVLAHLDAQAAEIAALRRERDEWKQATERNAKIAGNLTVEALRNKSRAEQAEAARDRLAAALRTLLNWSGIDHRPDCNYADTCKCGVRAIRDVVTAALAAYGPREA